MLFRRQKPELQQRQSTDESLTSWVAKTHRLMPSNGWLSVGLASRSDDTMKSSTTNPTDPLDVTWSSSSSVSSILSDVVDTKDCSAPESKVRRSLGGEEDKSGALELIRQLSFSPSRKTIKKRRTDTADTAESLSSDSSDPHHAHNTSPIGLDLNHLQNLRRDSPSPLLGLQYLPDGNMFI